MSDPIRPVRTNIFFDTEFVEDGETIMPISIGLVKETGEELYLEYPFDRAKAEGNDFVRQNVLPHIRGQSDLLVDIRRKLIEFAGPAPLFWAWYASCDWVVMYQTFGILLELPASWPRFCMDLRQSYEEKGAKHWWKPEKSEKEHHALEDARWNRKLYARLYGSQ